MGTLQIKTLLKGEDVKKFNAIKQQYGVIHDSEVIRICINNVFSTINEKTEEA